jgi:hypothetical protein
MTYWDNENKRELTIGITQCPKRFCQIPALELIGLKEGRKIETHGTKDKWPI